MRHGEPMPMQDESVHIFFQLTCSKSKELRLRCVRIMGDLVRHTMAAAHSVSFVKAEAYTSVDTTSVCYYNDSEGLVLAMLS